MTLSRSTILLPLVLASQLLAGMDMTSFQAYVDSVVPGSRFGLSVRSVKTGREIANVRGMEKFTPASTLKTLTTATALHFLPLDYEPKTEVALNGSVRGKTFWGTVNIRGEGDPNISARYYDDPFYIIFNLAWGGSWGGAQGVDESALPCTMEVDYVRVFQKK